MLHKLVFVEEEHSANRGDGAVEKLQHSGSSREVQPISQETGLVMGKPREQLQEGLGAPKEGAWVGVPVRLVRAMKPCWCPQDNGNGDNLKSTASSEGKEEG